MKITKEQLRQIIKEEIDAELNEGIIDFFKRMFGIRKPTEDAKTYLARLEKAIDNRDFKGHPSICKGAQVFCPEKGKCSQYCGKNPADMKKKIKDAAVKVV
tara:strand:+ start:313 stop:615 length:303 start_codon:yes stop_codon:yes gene_type:complete